VIFMNDGFELGLPNDSTQTSAEHNSMTQPLSTVSDTQEMSFASSSGVRGIDSATASSATLPAYDMRQPPCPSYAFTTTLSPIRLRQHLLLLAAVSQLKDSILALSVGSECRPLSGAFKGTQDCLRELDERGRWGLFVEMAARRFGVWQEKCIALNVTELPPLDVLMVWCSYLGSPVWSSFQPLFKSYSKLAPFSPGIRETQSVCLRCIPHAFSQTFR
jgi:hypothetical protein